MSPVLPRGLDLPTHEIVRLVRLLLDKGIPPDEVPNIVGSMVDAAIDGDEIGGPLGGVIEALDGPVARSAAKIIVRLVQSRRF